MTEQHDILNDYQFGFGLNKNTMDCISILQVLITQTLHSSGKPYCAFIEFQKTFDMVNRDGIWFKLLRQGAGTIS